MSPTAATSLDERYGRTRQRGIDKRVGWVLAGAAILLGLWVVFFGGWQTTNTVETKVIDYSVLDDRTTRVDFQVSAPPGTSVACAVEALSESFSTVGWKVLAFEPSEQRTRDVSAELVTTYRAATGNVYSCWPVTATR